MYCAHEILSEVLERLVIGNMINLDEIRKHMSQRDHWMLLSDNQLKQVHLTLADDVPDLVAEVERLNRLLRIAEDALGPDRTPTDRKDALMKLGKYLVENRVVLPQNGIHEDGCCKPWSECKCTPRRYA